MVAATYNDVAHLASHAILFYSQDLNDTFINCDMTNDSVTKDASGLNLDQFGELDDYNADIPGNGKIVHQEVKELSKLSSDAS